MKKLSVLLIAFLLKLSYTATAYPASGVLQSNSGQQDGYILFAPMSSTSTYLIDKNGQQIKSWNSKYTPGKSAYLLPDGSLLRTGNFGNIYFRMPGNGGIIEKYTWDGKLVWSYKLSDSLQCQHHDIFPMPNGNILAIVCEVKTAEEAIAAGRDPMRIDRILYSEKIIEIKPEGKSSGTIVWEWKAWDHLVQEFDPTKANYAPVAKHPELIDINYIYSENGDETDWLHFNSVTYNADLNQIMVSSYNLSEIWIIDHSTKTTSVAAQHTGGKSGKGGDLLFRWGNPLVYKGGTGDDQRLFGQHNPHWIEKGNPDAGKIIVFNNGFGRLDGNYSSVDIISPIKDKKGNYLIEKGKSFLPQKAEWSYSGPEQSSFYSKTISSAQQLPNGNILICNGNSGLFFEINRNKQIVWEYKNPACNENGVIQDRSICAFVFRCNLYTSDYSAFKQKKLTHNGDRNTSTGQNYSPSAPYTQPNPYGQSSGGTQSQK
ncbi:MAG: aryl-sulfate sulfotransferase [Bacteroidetes bacterium]|nr:aryl-sulfate sulfotransferase [Bacteroidota bacterium]